MTAAAKPRGERARQAASRLRATVIGGTYLDQEVLVTDLIRADVSLPVKARTSAIGGPGFSFAMRLADQGMSVRFVTLLGSCDASGKARSLLHGRAIEYPDLSQDVSLDLATVVIDPLGRKLALNGYELAQWLACTPELLETGEPLLVASPTPIASLLTSARRVQQSAQPLPPVLLAPHSRQVREIVRLPERDRRLLGRITTAVCVNEADGGTDLEEVFPPSCLLIVTHGAEGCSVREDGSWRRQGAVPLGKPVVNSNGAGEAFFAGVVHRLLAGDGVGASVRFGARAVAHYLETLHEHQVPDPLHTVPGGPRP